MKVVATIAASGKGLKSACAVKIQCNGFTHTRVMPFAKATVNQAELFALGYVLASVKSDLEPTFEITSFNTYVGRILERDGQGQFAITPEKNIEQVKEIRDLAGQNVVILNIEKTAQVTALREMIKSTNA
jgi:hypothetical protein